jgi:hypothetical protein
MIDTASFSKLVPGFDFLEKMMRGAGQAAPGMGQWIAPTLDPAELEKRIGELKTVLFWLEQNSRMLSATIQAMEVQRMTLSTLQTMNLPLAELQKAMVLPTVPPTLPAAAAPAASAPAAKAAKAADAPDEVDAPATKPGPVDPMLWWSALTQQFGELAAKAVQDSSAGISQLAKSLPKAGNAAGATVDTAKKAAPRRPVPAAAKTTARKAR